MIKQEVYSNELYISLFNNGKKVEFDDVTHISVVVDKPDQTKVIGSGEVVKDGLVKYTIDHQAIAALGIATITLKVHTLDSVMATSSFNIMVIADPYTGTDSSIISTTEYTVLQDLIDRHTLYVQAENSRVAAELLRVDAEDSRVVAEGVRDSNEDVRISNENTRKLNETSRVDAEALRVTQEDARKAAELIRISNEDARIAAEGLRDDAYTQAEATRDSNYSTAEIARNNSYGDAESARDNLYNTAEGNRGTSYTQAESNRDNLYATAELGRDSDYDDAEIARDNLYNTAEGNRDSLYNSAEAARDALYTTSEQGRDADYVDAEATRNNQYSTAEGDRDSLYTTAEAARDAKIGEMANLTTTEKGTFVGALNEVNADLTQHKLDYAEQRQQDQLKVANIEKDINDYKSTMAQVNVNQEAKQKVTSYGTISLPKNAANGQVSVSVNGLTATNAIKNGNFANGTTGWTGMYATISANNNTLSVVGNGALLEARVNETSVKTAGKYFICAKVRVTNALATSIQIDLPGSNEGRISLNNPVQNQWYNLSGIQKYKTDNRIFIRHNYVDATTANGKVLEIKEIIAINLTSLGLETLTKEQCDLIFANWFDGTKSTISASRLKSVDKDGIQESTLYLPNVGELRSLPNGTKDEIRVSGGKAEHIKNVSDNYVLTESDIEQIGTAASNIDYVITKALPNKSTLSSDTNIVNTTYITGRNEVPNSITAFNDVKYIGSFANRNDGKLIFIIAKGTTLAQAKTQLAGQKLTYQLAEPIITPIQVSGNLISYPSGTVYVENVVADAGIYGDNLNVLHTDLSIKEVEKVSKVDFTTGVETELDVSQCVIAEDKLSFTHPSLVDGDIVLFTYYYDLESTLGETTIDYYDSRHTIKDDVTGKFYKIVPKISDGVLTNELVEV